MVVSGGLLFAWLWQKRNSSLNIDIPANTVAVLRINTEQVIKENIFSAKKDSSLKQLNTGLNLPLNVFVYVLKPEDKNIFLSHFQIKNPEVFKEFIGKKFSETTELTNDKFHIYKNEHLPLYCVFNNESALFTNDVSAAAIKEMEDVLNRNNLIPLSQSKFAEVKNADSDAFYFSDNNQISVNFLQEEISIKGTTEGVPEIDEQYKLSVNPAATVYFSSKLSLPEFVLKYISENNTALNTDSLKQLIRPGFYFQIKDAVRQTVQSVTYEYNDDFEKTETVSFAEKQVPLAFLKIKADEKLCDYFIKNDILMSDSINKNVFPLYSLYADYNPDHLIAATARDFPSVAINVIEVNKKNVVAYGGIDFSQMKQKEEWKEIENYISLLQNADLTVRKNNNSLEYDAQIRFTDKSKSSLFNFIQLLKNLQQ